MLTGRWCGGDRCHVNAIDEDASAARIRETREHAQERRLAAAGGAHQREYLALEDTETDVIDCGVRAVGLADPVDQDLRVGARIHPGPVSEGFCLR